MKKILAILAAISFICLQITPAFANARSLSDKELDGIYAGNDGEDCPDCKVRENTLILQNETQKGLSALSNVNSVYSAVGVQSNVAINKTDVVNTNSIEVENEDHSGEECAITKNKLTIQDEAQSDLRALSNVNAVDSAVGVQSNITIGGTGSAISSNEALIINRDGDNGFDASINILKLRGNAQRGLSALSNVNAVDSAVGVQSNISINKENAENHNCAVVINSDADDSFGVGALNLLSISGEDAQQDLSALSNLAAVDSAAAVQSNIDVDTGSGGSSWNTNGALVINYDQEHMVNLALNALHLGEDAQKRLSVLLNTLVVDSAVAVQSNIAINQGDVTNYNGAIVLNGDGRSFCKGNLNALVLEENAQRELTALSNLNAVDSAVAVQSNIAANSVPPAGSADQTNEALVINGDGYNEGRLALNVLQLGDFAQKELTALSNVNSVDSAIAVQSNIAVNKGGALDNGDTEASLSVTSVSSVNNTNRARVINADLSTERGGSLNVMGLSGRAQRLLTALSNVNSVDSAVAVQSNITCNGANTGGDVNNSNEATVINQDEGSYLAPLVLADYVQGELTALSNVNALDSAVAVQSNIAVNYGSVGGNVTNSNFASVYNGPDGL